jgi:hypothetical protein
MRVNQYEYWERQHRQSITAVEMAKKHLEIIPVIGQLALFEDQKMGQLIMFPARSPESAA